MLVEPKLTPASVFDPMNEAKPVDVVNMPLGTAADKADGNNLPAIKFVSVIQGFPVDEAPRFFSRNA